MTKATTSQIRAIVACTERKRAIPEASLRLRNHRGNVNKRSAAWLERLSHPTSEKFEARELYRGEHWSEVRKLEQVSEGSSIQVDVWISSAGCGLVNLDEPLEPYSATFSKGHADSVPKRTGRVESLQWWQALSQRAPYRDLPRSICDLVKSDPETPIVIAVSAPYLVAIHDDLCSASENLADPDLLTVITTSSATNLPVGSVIPIDHRLQRVVGGTLNSIYARALNLILSEKPEALGSSKKTGEYLKRILNKTAPPDRPTRTALTDEEVVEYLVQTFTASPKIPARTKSLANLRSAGFACEQGRFVHLYELARTQVER